MKPRCQPRLRDIAFVAVAALIASVLIMPVADAMQVNRPPVIQNPGTQNSDVGDYISGRASVSDPDGDTLSYTATGLPTGLTISFGGLVTGTFSASGSYTVVLTADDGNGGSASSTFNWNVEGDDPPPNRPPVIQNPGTLSSDTGDFFSGRASSSDADGDSLSWTATGLPAGLSIATGGLVSGTISAAGTYTVVLTADDGNGGSDTSTFTWNVEGDDPPPNREPVIDNPGDQTSELGDDVSLLVSASDPDDDDLAFTATGLAPGLDIDGNGSISGTVSSAGTYTVTLTVEDGNGGADTTTFSWTVDEEPAAGGYDAPGDLLVPQPLPFGAPGSLIDTELLNTNRGLGYRILYHSTSAAGDDIAVSGFVRLPSGQAPAGGWPLIAWAHGTTGLADSCAPSLDAEFDSIATALNDYGYAVVATDYEGLGTPGLHTYMVGTSAAHAVLDSVRAVDQLGLNVTDEWVTLGFSQGGHAVMLTAQLQPTYAPELNLIGTVAAAPPSQMQQLHNSLVGSNFQGYVVMMAAGQAAADASLDIADRLSPTAIELLDVMETGCLGDIFDMYNPFDYYSELAPADPFTIPGWAEVELARDANLFPTSQPLLIVHGAEDYQVRADTSAELLQQLCAFPTQAPTSRIEYPDTNHSVLADAATDIIAWTEARFAGEDAPTQC